MPSVWARCWTRKPNMTILPLPRCERDDGGFALEAFGAVGVAGDEDVFGVVGIPGDDGALDVGRRRGSLEGDGRIDEGGDFVRHACADGMIGVEVNAQERAGDVEVGSGAWRRGRAAAPGLAERVANR